VASNAKTAIGSQLKRGDGGSPETFSKIAEIKSIKGPSQEADLIEVTNLDSTGGYQEFIPGLKKGGTLSCEANLVPQDATFKTVLSDFETQRKANWQLVLSDPSNTTASFAGYVSKLDRTFDPKSAMSVTIEITITGQITFAP